ncbi:hypothetical protein BJP27_23980 (plasmid) [Pseudomonas oryzihabitans]|nr:hypothetical protein BJP27_23980 [Pseudomonas psychrotolerans]
MSSLQPLLNTLQVGDVEAELAQLLGELFDSELAPQDNEINVYGAPHLGSLPLIQRQLSSDGLSVLNLADEAGLRYLHKAWRYRNPKRGLHFLRKYLQVLFGSSWSVDQLYQLKSAAYPTVLRSAEEIVRAGGAITDYFLTSRVRVDVNTSVVPERILKALLTTVAARIVLNVRVARQLKQPIGVVSVFRGCTIMRTSGTPMAVLPDRYLRGALAAPSATRGANLVFVTHAAEVRTAQDGLPPAGAVTVNGQLLLQDGQFVTT